MDTEQKGFSPPYNVPWATFLSTIEKVANDLPNKIDRSYLESQSGSVQTYLIAAFRSFGLINDDLTTTDDLKGLVSAEDRPAAIANLLRTYYPTIVPLGETSNTQGTLENEFASAFPSVTGESRVKSIRFFLSAAKYADLPLSSLWKTPKASGGTGTGRPRSNKANKGNKGGSGAGGGTAVQVIPPVDQTTDMRRTYFDLLVKKASDAGDLDSDLLDRIERLIGVGATPTPNGAGPSGPRDPDAEGT